MRQDNSHFTKKNALSLTSIFHIFVFFKTKNSHGFSKLFVQPLTSIQLFSHRNNFRLSEIYTVTVYCLWFFYCLCFMSMWIIL